MSDLNTYKVTDQEVQQHGLQGVVGDRLNLSPNQSKLRFDELPDLIRTKFNNALDRIDNLVAQTNAQTKSEINTTLTAHDTRLSNIEGRIDGDSFVANVNGSSTFSINTDRGYADIDSGTVAIANVIGQLGANAKSLKNSVGTVEDSIEEINKSISRISEYDNGSAYGTNINNFKTAGTYLTSADLTNVPSALSGKKLWVTIRRENPTSNVIYQEIENAEKFVEGSTVHQIGRWYRNSTNGGTTWGSWTTDSSMEYVLYDGLSASPPSHIRIGEILICMGVFEIAPKSKNKQYDKEIQFPVKFASIPHMQVAFGGSPEQLTNISANSITQSKFVCSIYSASTTSRWVRWMAIGKAVV